MIAQLDRLQIRLQPASVYPRLFSHFFLQGRPLTTRARWLNKAVLLQFSLVKRFPVLKKVEKPVFVLGTGRSGTTILGKILSLHPHINFLNEPKAIWYAAYSQEDLIGNYTLGPAHYRLGAEDVTPEVIKVVHQLYGYGLRSTGRQRVLDKYPEMIFRVPFILSIFPDAKFIFLIRNGQDTSQSIEKWSQQASTVTKAATHDWWGVDHRKWHLLVRDIVNKEPLWKPYRQDVAAFTQDKDMAVVEWIATMQEGLQLSHKIPMQLHKVYYEKLINSPRATLEALLEFCELPQDQPTMNYAEQTLNSVDSKKHFSVHPSIEPLFTATMHILGY